MTNCVDIYADLTQSIEALERHIAVMMVNRSES